MAAEFGAVGWTPPESLQVGPATVYFYSLFILAGIILGFLLARSEAKRFRISGETLAMGIFFALIPGFIGARLYHVIDQWSLYTADPASALAIWNGGLGILGGLAGGALGLWVYYRLQQRSGGLGKDVSFPRLLDIWAPSVLLAQAVGRFGNWTNQEAFGPPTDAPWSIFIDPAHRPEQYVGQAHFHPTFFYEAGFDLLGLALLLALRPRLRATPGAVLGAYLVIYGIGRFIIEFYRFDTAHVGSLAVAHAIAIALVILGAYLMLRPRPRAAGSAGSSTPRR